MEINTEVEIKPLKYLYGIGENFFNNLEDLRIFCGSHNRSMTGWFKLDYLGDYQEKKDVIRIWSSLTTGSTILTAGNITEKQNNDWESFCHERYDEKTQCWKLCPGNLITYYRALRNSGIEFSNDVYAYVEGFLDGIHRSQTETDGKRIALTIQANNGDNQQ